MGRALTCHGADTVLLLSHYERTIEPPKCGMQGGDRLRNRSVQDQALERKGTQTMYPECGKLEILVIVDELVLDAVQDVLFNKFVCAAYRAAHVARRLDRAIRAHAMLCTVVLTEVQRCCSASDRTRCSAGTLEGGSE